MRKRLIERITHAKKGSLGYTLTEMMVVIGIIAVVCAIAIPSIIAIRDVLRFAQANNYAKSIFLAAQQNLTELRSDGGLEPVQAAGGAMNIPASVTSFPDEYRGEYVYTTTGTEAFSRVLPVGSIDADIRDDQIVIEYNPLTGNVYSVFYYDKNDLNLAGQYPSNLPREKSARKAMMLGYYDGSGLNSSQIELEQTQAVVEFVNGQEGIVRVKIPMPETYFGDFDSFAAALDVDLSITGEYSTAKAAELNLAVVPMNIRIKSAGSMTGCKLDVDGKTVIVEYAIDSLANRSSFVNYLSDTQKKPAGEGVSNDRSLTTILEETEFLYTVLPGENITIQADVTFQGTGEDLIRVAPGIISGVNPMFESMLPGATEGRYVLTLSNGRNLQNLNAISPTIAKQVEAVIFNDDIYWNDTVSYYNDAYAGGSTYHNTTMTLVGDEEKAVYDEAPARALPYFVPIHNEDLFGTARFIFPGQNEEGDSEDGGLGEYIWNKIKEGIESGIKDFGGFINNEIPTLTDELDRTDGDDHAIIQGNGHKVLNLRIDSTKYQIPNVGREEQTTDVNGNSVTVDYTGTFYATGDYQLVDYAFTGLFGYVNTPIDDLHVVNPIIKGYNLTHDEISIPTYITIKLPFIGEMIVPGDPKVVQVYNNPATGALVGASGYNTWITNCSTYIDKDARGYMNLNWGPYAYNKDAYQSWYGVMGEGAVGGLVGYAKSHLNTTGQINGQEVALAFSDCFAAVPVSGNMRGHADKQFGYSNGVGGFIGNSQLTNFYNCYSSGDVLANNCAVYSIEKVQGALRDLTEYFGITLDLLYTGRTSTGAGGFVGSSHGTRYTNCFATGNVTASVSNDSGHKLGGGGFVGFMSIDETFGYGHDAAETANIAQRTIFTNCYSVGMATTNSDVHENFSGANGRIALKLDQSVTYLVGDYFRLYAPYYAREGGKAPEYGKTHYIYRDSYFLSNYHTQSGQDNSSSCASPDVYSTFENLPGVHEKDTPWMIGEINEIKNIPLKTELKWVGGWDGGLEWVVTETYETNYFTPYPALNTIYKNLYDEGFSPSDWNAATASTTHPYSLTAGQRYPFTKLAGLDYYGDWPSKPSDVGMAYYETYSDTGATHYFFDKSHTENASLTLREGENVFVSKDGYAIFSANNADLTVTISDNDANTADISDTLKVTNETHTVNSKAYHVFRLSEKLMNALPSDGEFYVKVTAKHSGTSDTYTMYFNPNVAISHVNPVEGKKNADKPDAAPATVYIRSARQLKGIATLDDFWGDGYRYIQQLNIDAAAWADQNKDIKLTSVGTAEKPFNASYSAGYTVVDNDGNAQEKQYKITGFTAADGGIFGVIGEKGSVSDVIVEFASDITAGNAGLDSIAILAGVNGGTIDNVKLELKGNVTLTARTNAGLLAGLSTGSVIDSPVTASGNVTLTASNAGGLIGSVAGVAERRAQVTDSSLTIGGTLNIGTAEHAGGLTGSAVQVSVENCSVGMKGLTTQAEWAGGLVGHAEDASFVGSTDANLKEVRIDETLSARGCASGVLGNAKNVTMTGVDLIVKSVSGASAQGFLGNGVNVDPSNCTVKITQAVTGQSGAAGVAGSIGEDSVFNRVSADLSNVTVSASAGDAAGYALEIKAQAMVMGQSGIVFDRTTITASGTAAGYACVVNGSVGDVSAAGKGSISGANAAGFAAQINGSVESIHVSPARNQNDYMGNSNANLTVTGTDSAAGFALAVGSKGTVSNSYTLCTVSSSGTVQIEKAPKAPAETAAPAETTESSETTASTGPEMENVTSAYGFVGTNDGTINRCMANVDIADGFGFAGINNGLIASSYGWYSDGVADTVTAARGLMTGDGRCNNSYFAICENSMRASEAVLVYDDQGIGSPTTLNMLQGLSLNGFTVGYGAWPYVRMNPDAYPYPMLRDHYGNWVKPPEYAYGVAYYEKYSDGTMRLHMEDLSSSANTMEQKDLSYRGDVFDNYGQITETGYAMFYNAAAGKREGNLVLTREIGNYTYHFYAIEADEEYRVPVTTDQTRTAVLDTRFADAIVVGAEAFADDYSFRVRTPEQLAYIGRRTASYEQTHDISTTDVTTASIADGKTYDGKGLKLTVTGQTRSWLDTVVGTVTNLNLEVTDAVTAPIFGTVSGTVSLNSVNLATIQEGGALVASAGGTVTLPGITVSGSVDGNIIGTVSGTVKAGTITTGSVSGSIFANAASGTLVTGTISTDAVTGSIFGAVRTNVTVGGITTGTLSGNVIASLEQGTVTTGDISLASRTASLVGTFTGGMLQGDEGARKSITVGDLDEAANAVLFSQTVGGSIRNYTYSTSGKFDGLAAQMSGSLTGVDVSVNGNAGVPFLGTMGGQVDNVHFTVIGNADAALITTLSGTMQNSKLHVSSASNGLIGTVNGKLDTVTLTVDGSMSGSAIGQSSAVLNKVSLSAETVTAAGGVLVGSNSGSFSECIVDVTNVTASGGNFGIVANRLNADKTLDATVSVDTLTFTAKADSNVGGMVGVNGGRITGGTVTIQAAKPTQGVILNGAAAFQTSFGGLVGSNGGTISGAKANVDVTYVQPNVDTDRAMIGGLVGAMNSGSIEGSGSNDATGSITLSGDGDSRAYVVGGAVGALTGGTAQTTAVQVAVAPEWADARNHVGGSTFGTSGIQNHGPVGMFVGYAGNVSLTNCSSTDSTNKTYQFLGEAMVETTPLSGLWKSDVKKTGALKAYSDHITDGVYSTYDPVGYSFSAAASYNRVAPTISGCFFQFGGATKEQCYGVDVHYYAQSSTKENGYVISGSSVAPAISGKDITVTSKEYNSTPKAIGYYYFDGTRYCPVSIKYVESGSIFNKSRIFYLVETGNETNVLTQKEGSYNWRVYYEAEFTLSEFTNASLSGTYATIKDNGAAINSQGAEFTVPNDRIFDQRDDLLYCIWNASGNRITNIADGVAYDMVTSFTKDGSPVMVYEVGGVFFNLYPVQITANGSRYSILTFTYQDNANYQRQFITAK